MACCMTCDSYSSENSEKVIVAAVKVRVITKDSTNILPRKMKFS